MKRQNIKNISIEKVAKRLAKHITEQEVYGWPPLCSALYYQPVRPKKEKIAQLISEEHSEKL